MNALSNLWGREPTMIVSLVGALLSLAVSFGLQLTAEQTAAIIAVVQVGLGLIIRSQVTPSGNLPLALAELQSEDEPLAAPYIPGEDDNV